MSAIFNAMRDAVLPTQEIEARKEAKFGLTVGKLISVAVAFFVSALFVFYPGLFTCLLAGVGLLAAHEAFQFCSNVFEIFENAITEVAVRSSDRNMVLQLSKNTLVLKPLLMSEV